MQEGFKENGFYYFLSKFLTQILPFLNYLLQEIHTSQIIRAKLTQIIWNSLDLLVDSLEK